MHVTAKEFLAKSKPLLEDCHHFDLRLIALQHPDGRWVLNTMAVRASSSPIEPFHGSPPGGLLLVRQEQGSREDFVRWVEEIENRQIVVDGHDVFLPVDSSQGGGVSYNSMFLPDRMGSAYNPFEEACLFLEVSQSSSGLFPNEGFDRIDSELRTSAAPYDGLLDLRQSFADGRPNPYQHARSAMILFTIPAEVRLESMQVSADAAVIYFRRKDQVPLEGVVLTLIGSDEEGKIRKRLDLREAMAQSKDVYSIRASLEKRPTKLKAILTRHGFECGRLEYESPTPIPETARAAALSFFRPNWPSDISGDGLRGRDFEHWVADTLAVLGYTCFFSPKPIDGPDIVAFPANGDYCLVAECSVSAQEASSKLAKLSTRAAEIEGRLKRRALPLFVTSQPHEKISPVDLQRAARDGTSILAREQLLELVQSFEEGVQPGAVTSRLEEFVPQIESPSGGSMLSIGRSRLRRNNGNFL